MKQYYNILKLLIGAVAILTMVAMPEMSVAAGKNKTKVVTEEQTVKPLSYNKLLKSHDYETMYERALEYFNYRKANRKGDTAEPVDNRPMDASECINLELPF